jgi:hypothetical protein
MPATKTKPRIVKRAIKQQPLVAVSHPGYISDEVLKKVDEAIRKTTPEEFRQNLIRFGITDKKGRFYSGLARNGP